MSELQLSNALINEVRELVKQHDPESQNPVMYAQYLSAFIGIAVSDLKGPEDSLKDLLNQLHLFSVHVFEEQFKLQQVAEPSGEAFGIWRPDDN